MKKFGALLMAVLLVVGATPSAFAAEQETVSEPYSIEFNDSTFLQLETIGIDTA